VISILPYEPAHRAMLVVQQAQRDDLDVFRQAAGMMAERGPAFTAAEVDESGAIVRVLGCAGLAENGPDYATCWAAFGDGLALRDWAVLAAAIRRVIAASVYGRIDLIVRGGFGAGERFARHLGFVPDATIYRYVPREPAFAKAMAGKSRKAA
jgi:hypothetical protein